LKVGIYNPLRDFLSEDTVPHDQDYSLYLIFSNRVRRNAMRSLENAKTAAAQSKNLREAALDGDQNRVQYLLGHRANPNSKDPQAGRTALSQAAEDGCYAVVELLLKQKNISLNSEDEDCRTPLSFSAEEGHEAVVELLLKQNGIEPDSKDKDLRTPLSYAAEEGHEGVVKLLLDRRVDLDSKDKDNQMSFLWVPQYGRKAARQLQKDVDPNSKDKTGRPCHGRQRMDVRRW